MACRFTCAGITILSFFLSLHIRFLHGRFKFDSKGGRKPLLRWCRRSVYVMVCAVWFSCRCSFCQCCEIYGYMWTGNKLKYSLEIRKENVKKRFIVVAGKWITINFWQVSAYFRLPELPTGQREKTPAIKSTSTRQGDLKAVSTDKQASPRQV